MQHLNWLAELERLRLIVGSLLDPLKCWAFETKQQLDAIDYNLPLGDMRECP